MSQGSISKKLDLLEIGKTKADKTNTSHFPLMTASGVCECVYIQYVLKLLHDIWK